jgi:hypothetical protein
MMLFLFAAETEMQRRNSKDKQSDGPKIDLVEEATAPVMEISPSQPVHNLSPLK